MKSVSLLFVIILLATACEPPPKAAQQELLTPVKTEKPRVDAKEWQTRHTASREQFDSLQMGKTYLSVYSRIYSISEERMHDLTVTVSLRNTSSDDTIYVLDAKYYDTQGELVRHYFDQPVFLSPMETVEIVIREKDIIGGTGGNFLFSWAEPERASPPLFEAVMISTLGKQGLSFTTQGVEVK